MLQAVWRWQINQHYSHIWLHIRVFNSVRCVRNWLRMFHYRVSVELRYVPYFTHIMSNNMHPGLSRSSHINSDQSTDFWPTLVWLVSALWIPLQDFASDVVLVISTPDLHYQQRLTHWSCSTTQRWFSSLAIWCFPTSDCVGVYTRWQVARSRANSYIYSTYR